MSDKDISSAEMTATWRCDEPQFSHDRYSVQLVSAAGLQKTREYETQQYPLVRRHMSLRAGFITDNVVQLVEKNRYDAVVSLGSGLSLISHCIAEQLQRRHYEKPVTFIDSDLTYMINKRIEGINVCKEELPDTNDLFHFKNIALDIEATFQSAKKDNKLLQDYIPNNIEKPVFILEGIVYFLSNACLDWLFESFQRFDNVAVVMDYLPEEAPQQSQFFEGVINYFKTNIPEAIQNLIAPEAIAKYTQPFLTVINLSLAEVEQQYVVETEQQILTEINNHIPARLCVMTK